MTSYPGQPATAPRRILTWLAVASFVVALLLTGYFVWRIVETAPRTPHPIGSGPVALDKEGLTIYASIPVLAARCEAKDSNGADVPLKRPAGSETIGINSETWYVVARSVDKVPPGSYAVDCPDDESSAVYAVGPRSSVVGFVVAIFGAIGSLLVFGMIGVILLIVSAIKNRRATRPPTTFPPPGQQYNPGNTFPAPGQQGYYAPPPGFRPADDTPPPGTGMDPRDNPPQDR